LIKLLLIFERIHLLTVICMLPLVELELQRIFDYLCNAVSTTILIQRTYKNLQLLLMLFIRIYLFKCYLKKLFKKTSSSYFYFMLSKCSIYCFTLFLRHSQPKSPPCLPHCTIRSLINQDFFSCRYRPYSSYKNKVRTLLSSHILVLRHTAFSIVLKKLGVDLLW